MYVRCPTSFFCICGWLSSCPTSFIGKVVPSPSNCLGAVIENQSTLNARIYFCCVSSTPVIFVCSLMSVCLDS